MCPNVYACKVHLIVLYTETRMLYILCNRIETAANGKIIIKIENRNSKSRFYFEKWTDFNPDEISLSNYYIMCCNDLVGIMQPILMS